MRTTFVACDHGLAPDQDQRIVRDFGTCRLIVNTQPVPITVPMGAGKSLVAQAPGHMAVRQGFDVLSAGHVGLLAQSGAAHAAGTYERQRTQLTRIDLLILDDFLLWPMTIPQEEQFHGVVAPRHRKVSTVLTSNMHETEFPGIFGTGSWEPQPSTVCSAAHAA